MISVHKIKDNTPSTAVWRVGPESNV